MRLSSLARKIKLTPKQLSKFLTEKGIDVSKGSNSKLSEETVALVQEAFQFAKEETPVIDGQDIPVTETVATNPAIDEQHVAATAAPLPIEDSPTVDPTANENPPIPEETHPSQEIEEGLDSIIQEQEPEETEETFAGSDTQDTTTQNEEEPKEYEPIEQEDGTFIEARAELAAHDESVQLIRAAKAKPLQGLTIKGKIELPKPKTPEEIAKKKAEAKNKPLDPDTILYTSGPSRESSRKPRRNNRTKNQQRKKPQINSVEAERRRKEQAEKKQLAHKLKKEKEAKTQYYQSKVSTAPKSQVVKKKKATPKTSSQKKPKSANIVQKFWHWLNT
ncbi:hypothetical protein BFP72_02650 [Reichenbachiella sp. 5M10]|uniref:translation initiation factor IF-2 N-terminal domain-containing protein n=1 Tax=Reichenbachiella sp. 5M10 TaxID=1889772 RepID=UPI000C14F056|nr:translation initiation factor IF-2 N-terminal domain-containing protein [Reichenbachiella sp. 5M10]PIB34399.1 hypothetical protein BFP72_02650 [Reichenbachiella sp. 5M10]